MGLLDSVLGQVLGGAQPQQPQNGGLDGSMRSAAVLRARSAGCSPTTAK